MSRREWSYCRVRDRGHAPRRTIAPALRPGSAPRGRAGQHQEPQLLTTALPVVIPSDRIGG